MHSGSLPGAVFTNAAVSDPVSGEITTPSTLSFRAAARVENWKVRRYLSDWREVDGLSDGLEHAGWECPGEGGDFEELFQAWAEPAIVDAEEWGLDVLRAYKRDCDDAVVEESPVAERVFEKTDGDRVGAYVKMFGVDFQFGWLILSGKKHAQFDAD
ncbi:hypothetical protein C8A05DRAFT_33095, partial [Staphylotrichum tortipilum]